MLFFLADYSVPTPSQPETCSGLRTHHQKPDFTSENSRSKESIRFPPVNTLFVVKFQRIKEKKYETREAFIHDLNLLVQNSELYNGPKSVLTDTAKKMLDLCLERIAEVCLNL